jgi:dTDP-4-amino-4,6-dideoxygalactose transaminase
MLKATSVSKSAHPDHQRYRFPFIRPLIPPVTEWAEHLELAYGARWFSNFGPVTRKFESQLGHRFCGSNEIMITASNCTAGISAALIALKVHGAVLIPAFTFPATMSAVIMAGAEPCVLDVDLETWCLSLSRLEKSVRSGKYDAVVLVAPFGLPRDFSEHFQICQKYNVPVVIDNAAGLGGKVVALPDENCFEVFSLHATKPFAIGEGGVIRSQSHHAEALRLALNFGLEHGAPAAGCWGINGKLPEVGGAIGLAVLESYDEVLARRRSVAQSYIELLRDYDSVAFCADVQSAPWQSFPVLFSSPTVAQRFLKHAAEKGLQARAGYHPTLENWPRTRSLGDSPNARFLAERMMLLPVYSDSTEDEVAAMSQILRHSLEAALTD